MYNSLDLIVSFEISNKVFFPFNIKIDENFFRHRRQTCLTLMYIITLLRVCVNKNNNIYNENIRNFLIFYLTETNHLS